MSEQEISVFLEELRADLINCIEKLPNDDHKAVARFKLDDSGMTYEEIGHVLGISLSLVKQSWLRAKPQLHVCLNQKYEDLDN